MATDGLMLWSTGCAGTAPGLLLIKPAQMYNVFSNGLGGELQWPSAEVIAEKIKSTLNAPDEAHMWN